MTGPRELEAITDGRDSAIQRYGWILLLMAVCVLWWLVLRHWATSLWLRTGDAGGYRILGLGAYDNLPGSLWAIPQDGTGIQRIAGWTLGFSLGRFGAPDGFIVARAIGVSLWVAAAWPTWAWARALGAARGWAALAAILAIAGPWSIYTNSFLTEPSAYLLVTVVLYLTWRAAVRPRPVVLLMLAVTILFAGLARTVMLLYLPIAFAVVFLTAFRYRKASGTGLLPFAIVGAAAAVVVGVLVLGEAGVADRVVGRYGTGFGIELPVLKTRAVGALALISSGAGVLPAVLALAFGLVALVAPRRREDFALVLVGLATFILVVFSAARAGEDERYLIYLIPWIMVAAAYTASTLAVSGWALAASAVAVLGSWMLYGWSTEVGYAYFNKPVSVFHGRVLDLGLPARLGVSGASDALAIAGAVIAVGCVAFAVAKRGRLSSVMTGLLVAAVVGFQITATAYSARHFIRENAFSPTRAAGMSWVDTSLPPGASSGFLSAPVTPPFDIGSLWNDLWFWNLRLEPLLNLPDAPPFSSFKQARPVTVDYRNGMIRASDGQPLPEYIVQWSTTPDLRVVGRETGQPWLPARMVKADRPVRVAWALRGTDGDAFLRAGSRPARILVYEPGAPSCLAVTLRAADRQVVARARFTVDGSAVTLASGESRRVVVGPLAFAGPRAQVRFSPVIQVPADADGTPLVRIDDLERLPCPKGR